MDIQEDLTLGIDLGIASCGWAMIRGGDGDGQIVGMGVWMFDAPETAKERTPTNQLRRQHRGLRRVLKRRRQRMNELRQLFKRHGLIEGDGKDALHIAGLDPWRLRAEGLDRKLTGPELAVVLAHIAKHRGFKSNSKRDRGANAPKDTKDFYKGIEGVRARLETSRSTDKPYRTIGEMFAADDEFAARKRNRDGQFTKSILRQDQEDEVRIIFAEQRRMQNAFTIGELEQAFIDEAFFQRSLADSEDKVGYCLFERAERRTARRSYSFELFRFLSKLAALRIRTEHEERSLSPEEIARVEALFGKPGKITYKGLRKVLGLASEQAFGSVKPEEENQDFVARSGTAAPGTAILHKTIAGSAGEQAWNSLRKAPERLDQVAFVLSFRESPESIRKGLDEIGLDAGITDGLLQGVGRGDFSEFTKSGHISTKAAQQMIPHLRQGLVYSDAATAAGYEHSDANPFARKGLVGADALRAVLRSNDLRESIGSPVTRKAVSEATKQVVALVQEYGIPGRIHVELAREVGKSERERAKLKAGQDERTSAKEKHRNEFESVVGQPLRSEEDLLRYELWKEQNGRCLYTDRAIDPSLIVAGDRTLEVDHILPRSKSGENSFHNKILCFASANQEKKGLTPYGWLGENADKWAKLTACIDGTPSLHKQKRRNLLTMRSLAEIEERFKPRNLNDTQYAARALLSLLACMYPPGERGVELPRFGKPERQKRRVFARPGRLTDTLRRTWKVQDLKKDEAGARRSDDRHHALDALICAATNESALNRLTRQIQEQEDAGFRRDIVKFDPPWPGFVEEARAKLREVFVARAERRRARGEAHAATIRGIAERDGKEAVYEKKKVEALTLADLDRVKDPERNVALIATVRAWIDAGKPADQPPVKRFGGPNIDGIVKEPERFEPIRKVKLRTNKKVDVLVRDGAAERGEMVRVDVFRKQNKRNAWEYYLVPIYPHQVADAEDWPNPPNRAVVAYKAESEWPEMNGGHEFMWSAYPLSFLEIEKSDGTFIDGYFRGTDRTTGAISLSAHKSKDASVRGIGAKTLRSLRKVFVDRLGRRFEVPRETRTWRGVACT